MATDFQSVGQRRFSVGQVFGLAGRTVAHHGVIVLAAWALIAGMGMLTQLIVLPTMSINASADATYGRVALSILSYIVNFAASAVAMVMFTFAVVSESHGRRASVSQAFAAGLPLILPVIGFTILWSIGVGIGFILLLVPGLILMTMWAVGVPAMVVERSGVFGAFGRSRELTKGYRWPVFGILLIVVVIYYLIIGSIGFSVGVSSLQTMNDQGELGSRFTAFTLVMTLVGSLIYLAWGLLSPAIYTELRRAHEGSDIEGLEQIFA